MVASTYSTLPPLPWLGEGLRALALLIDPQLPEPAVVPPWLEAAEVTRWNASHWDASHWYASRWYQFWDERLALLAVVLYAVFVPRSPRCWRESCWPAW